ncbi:MAG: hypothetical protein AB7O32_19595 [Vicinamibacterales bacterium]
MTVSTIVAVGALLIAAAALALARRTARQFNALSESYWQLRYDYGQLRSRVARLEEPDAGPSTDDRPGPQRTTATFVPLSSLKR